jgi:agmatinase
MGLDTTRTNDNDHLEFSELSMGTLSLSRFVEIETQDARTVTIFHGESGRRRRISRSLYQIMRRFEHPASPARVIPSRLASQVVRPLQQLVAAGFLLELDRPSENIHSLLTPAANTLFRAPSGTPSRGDADLVVIGLPFDGGNVVAPGARLGPAELRRYSWNYPYRIDFESAAPVGWFDVESERMILEGVTVADWGDIHFTHGESAETIYQRAQQVAGQIIEHRAFPLLIGGDHSVTYPIVSAFQGDTPLTIIWLDAHLDRGAIQPGCCHNHKNVVRRLSDLPNVKKVINVGYRGYASGDAVTSPPEKMEIITPGRLRRVGIESVVDIIPHGQACYVSCDIDVLDPSFAAGTATPVPGGLLPCEVRNLLRCVGEKRPVVGMDIVELNPLKDPSGVTCLLACELLLAALGSALQHRGRYVKNSKSTNIMEHELWKLQ